MPVDGKPQPAEQASPAEYPSNHDRVLDAYFGKIGNQFMRDTQKRVHWVCGMAQGKRILDVGCSQGIVPVLIGREGFTVIGIDSDEEAIATARAFLADQNPVVRKNVTFIHDDFVSHSFADLRFDTVIISEVFEHLVNPSSFVLRAAQLLNNGGRLVVTVPFGVNDFIDHKRTYYALEPIRLIWELFSVEEVELFGKWIGFSCTKRQTPVRERLTEWPWSLVEKIEDAFQKIERALIDQISALRSNLEKVNEKNKAQTEQLATLRQQLVDLPALEQTLATREKQLKVAEESQEKYRNEITEIRSKLDEANVKYRAVTESLISLKERIAKSDAELARKEQSAKEEHDLLVARDQENAALQEHVRNLQMQIERRREDSDLITADKDRLLKESEEALLLIKTEAAEARGSLDDMMVKYRDAAETLESLQKRIPQADVELARAEQRAQEEQQKRQAAEEKLAVLQMKIDQQNSEFEKLVFEKDRMIKESEAAMQKSSKETSEVRSRLEEANVKYRGVTEALVSLKERLPLAEAEIARATQNLQEEREKRREIEKELANLQLQFDRQRMEHEMIAADKDRHLRSSEEDLQKMRSETTELRSRLEEANANYRASTDHAAALKERLQQIENESKKIILEKEAQVKEIEGLQRKSSEEANATKSRLEAANVKYRDVTEALVSLKERISQSEAELVKTGQSLQEERTKRQFAENELTTLQEQVAQLKAQFEQQRTILDQVSAEKNDHQRDAAEELARRSREMEEVRGLLEEANGKYKAESEQSDLLKSRLAQLETAYAKSEEENVKQKKASEESLVNLTNEATALRSRLEEANVKYRAVTEQSTLLKERISQTEKERARTDAALQEERSLRLANEKEQANLHNQFKNLQAQIDQQKTAHEQAIDLKESKIRSLETDAVRLREEASEIEGDLEAATHKCKGIEEQAAFLTGLIEKSQSETTALREEVQSELTLRIETEKELVRLQEQLKYQHTLHEESVGVSQKKIESIKALLENSRREVNAIKTKLKSENAVFAGSLEEIQRTLQEEGAAHQDANVIPPALKQLSDELATMQARLEAADTACRMLSAQMGDLKTQLAQKDRELDGAMRETEALRKTSARSQLLREPAPAELPELRIAAEQKITSDKSDVPEAVANQSDRIVDIIHADALKNFKVACIMDEFTYGSYQPECNLLQLTPQHWENELAEFMPELLFIESAWRGKEEKWGNKVGHKSDEVQGIVSWCRSRRIPTVFWNKEDPIHFETFLSTAKLFDYVFTTDIDCIHRYKGALGHDRVYLLPFACQPSANNPLETYERKDAFCFAGAYYVRYPERTRDLGNFVSTLATYRPVEIYDRNYGKSDPNYQFPEEYQPFIVGNLPFDQIDRAYKGYRYAINLNSIKQSQTMFARRVFDLLASNTITVSNFSRGVRLLFGDLVVTTDSGDEIVRRLEALGSDDVAGRKYRLAGLRKIMQEHTYQDRLAYVVSKVQGRPLPGLLPRILVTAYAKNQQQLDALQESFQRQTYAEKRLLVVTAGGFTPENIPESGAVQILSASAMGDTRISELLDASGYLAAMVPDDYYGPNYLLDLALATRYSTASAIGKVTQYVWSAKSGLGVVAAGKQYQPATGIPVRSALAKRVLVEDLLLRDWIISLYSRQIEAADQLGIDEFNYCKNGNSPEFLSGHAHTVNDREDLDLGIGMDELLRRSERIETEEAVPDESPILTGEALSRYFKPPANKGYKMTVSRSAWEVESSLADEKHDYLYAATDVTPAELGYTGNMRFHFDVTPGLNLQLVLIFLDAQKQRISNVVKTANRNQEVAIPAGAEWIRLGLRIYGGGTARINALVLGHRVLRPAEVIGRAEHLVLTNQYPSYDDLYRNSFVHSRVAAYNASNVRIDVFRLRNNEALSYHEFHDVDVISGSQEALNKLLQGNGYKNVLVHFLDENMWRVLQHHVDRINLFVWVHGFEIQPWYRREFNYTTDQQRDAARIQSEARMTFWRNLLKKMPDNLKLIFVSSYLAEVVMEDLGFRLSEKHYVVIHNAIDTELFSYREKSPEQRKKILSIRPYASRTYANDLSVRTIQLLSTKPWFNELEFRIIGDGELFDEVLAPLRSFKNVTMERRFITHAEIAALHREYGIFLCPTRMDTQGVSRDEAMSSGLVPITNRVAAIPEFVDETCGILAEAEDADGMAAGISELIDNPARFSALSKAASERVRRQSGFVQTIIRELDLIK